MSINTLGNVFATLWMIFKTVEDVQHSGKYHQYYKDIISTFEVVQWRAVEGYYQYYEGCSILCRETISTVEIIPKALKDNPTQY